MTNDPETRQTVEGPTSCPRCGHNWKFGEISKDTCGFHQCGCKHEWHGFPRTPTLSAQAVLETEQTMHAAWRKRAEESETKELKYRAVIEWIAGQTDLFFAECSQAEEIVARCKEALTEATPQTRQSAEEARKAFDAWFDKRVETFGGYVEDRCWEAWSAASLQAPSPNREDGK